MIFDFFRNHFSDRAMLVAVWLLVVCALSVLYFVVARRVRTIEERTYGAIPSRNNLLLWDFLCWSSILAIVGLVYYASRDVSDVYTKSFFFMAMFFTLLLFFAFIIQKFFGKRKRTQQVSEI